MNVSFRDYPTMIKAKGYNGFPKQSITVVKSDTTSDIKFAHGTYYTVKTTSPTPVKLTAGTNGVVTIVPLPRVGDEQLFALVAVGNSGQATGIYTSTGNESALKRFVFYVK